MTKVRKQFLTFEKRIIYFKVQHKVVFLITTHSILYLKTWLCAFQFIFKINSRIQMLDTSSTNSSENAYKSQKTGKLLTMTHDQQDKKFRTHIT